MKTHFTYDRVLKDLFQTDNPTLLEQLTGGLHVKEFLNVEFPCVMERRADLVARLEDGSIVHFEFQGRNDGKIGYRQGIYCLLIAEKYERPVHQVVLYLGNAPMRMKSALDAGSAKVKFRLMDIREIAANQLMQSSRASDWALALLAAGGEQKMSEIMRRICSLNTHARIKALTQVIVLSGLRGYAERLRMELSDMGSLNFDIRDNVILWEMYQKVLIEGKAEGKAIGKAEGKAEGKVEGKAIGEARGEAKGKALGETFGMAKMLSGQLETKFGKVPKWAQARLQTAKKVQLGRWSRKIITAETLEAVIGKR